MIKQAWVWSGLLLGLGQSAWAADGSFDRHLKVSGPVLLSIETGAGYVHITAGSDTEVHVVAHVHAGSGMFGVGGDAAARVRAVTDHPPIQQAGNIISVGKNLVVQNVAIDYEVSAPPGTDLRVSTGSGDVEVRGDKGPVEVKTGSGSITGSGLANRVWLETGSGNITADVGGSINVRAQTGSGSIGLTAVGGSLWAHTGSGDIKVSGKPTQNWKVETGTGSVTLETSGAPFSLDAETGSGEVDAPNSQSVGGDKHHVTATAAGGGPKVRVTSGSGDIRVR